MSVTSVRAEIGKFLRRRDPEVLCLRGKWGVGKTHIWREQLKSAIERREISRDRYSYVSVFGLNSIEDVRAAVFQNAEAYSDGIARPDLKSIDAALPKWLNLRKISAIASNHPLVSKFVGKDLTSIFMDLTIRDQIICVDDLERRGKCLDIADLLGLLSDLALQRNCKVVLILNDEKLADGRASFDQNVEKVVEISLLYEPTATESAAIAVPETDEISAEIRRKCIFLGIKNIRVIRRAARMVREVKSMLTPYDDAVFIAVLPSVILFTWARDQPDDAPPLDLLRVKTAEGMAARSREGSKSDKEVAWDALLEAYGYMWADELDLLLIRSVTDGHFDIEILRDQLEATSAEVVANRISGSFEAAWRGFHDSFADDQEEVLDNIYASFMRSVRYISPVNLDGAVHLFKQLGRCGQAVSVNVVAGYHP